MIQPYLQSGNLYFVPVLRNRLTFALLVRQAIASLQSVTPWTSEDLIAVVLPPSVQDPLREGIERLPKVSLLLTSIPNEQGREVFPITPCDAMVEAVRLAGEEGWQVEFIDLEVSPGNLLRGPCTKNPNWPDDMLVKVLGVERYLDMIEGYFSQPPARLEPLDTWREGSITSRLRHLSPLWRRVLIVCDASLTRPVIARLKQPSTSAALTVEHAPGRVKYQLMQQLRLDVLLGYLDDYPKIVERYEEWRWQHEPDFDKFATLLHLVLESADKAHDLHFSTREHKTFDTFLRNLLRFGKRVCPQPNVLYQVAASCFGVAFAERLHCFLTSYDGQIKVERVKPNLSVGSDLFQYQLEIDSALHKYVSRSCDPTPPSYIVDPPPPRRKKSPKSKQTFYKWLPENRFLLRMHRKLKRAVTTTRRERKVLEYRGGIEMGIDVRRTLRSYVSGVPKLYVKGYSRMKVPVATDDEPIVWVLAEGSVRTSGFSAKGVGESEESKIQWGTDFPIGKIEILEEVPSFYDQRLPGFSTLTYNENQSGGVLYGKRCGRITFAYDYQGLEEAREKYGAEFTARVPNHGKFKHPFGCVDPDFADLAKDGERWLEVALLTALKYAKHAVVIVAPAGFIVPSSVLQHTLAKHKTFVFSSLSHFSHSEREKLTASYRYVSDEEEDAESNFRIIMRRFWE